METQNTMLPVEFKHSQNMPSIYLNDGTFEHAQRIAKSLASSSIVPDDYKNNLPNCLVALEYAARTGASPLVVMQNLHVIKGRPSWASSYIIAAINACGRYKPLKFKIENLGQKTVEYTYIEWEGKNKQRKTGTAKIEDMRFIAYTTDLDGNDLESPPVTIEMAVREGWYTKADSKWTTMPELMGRYRAAAFFGRLYCPEILLGLLTEEEAYDAPPVVTKTKAAAENLNNLASQPSSSNVTDVEDATIVSEQPHAPAADPLEGTLD